jgi:hypothetical protein
MPEDLARLVGAAQETGRGAHSSRGEVIANADAEARLCSDHFGDCNSGELSQGLQGYRSLGLIGFS